jgi:hypothetical protein
MPDISIAAIAYNARQRFIGIGLGKCKNAGSREENNAAILFFDTAAAILPGILFMGAGIL